ncbi:MAG: DNA-protecting protein DprA [Proteobacteria bacterium]|nr:MAG: DNA-protecting protein DprA [Pseudomonadota bacterium]
MNTNENELRARLQIWRAPGIGTATINRLLAHFGTATHALDSSHAELIQAGLKQAQISSLKSVPEQAVEADLEWLQGASHRHILLEEDEHYPALLRATRSAPPLLFVVGHPELLNDPQIAMVGSRNPSKLGQETAHAFAQYLAGNGLCITSGLALGIDSYSHQGAIDAGGTTIAVVGTGLDIIYPARNRALAERIVEHGAIVSEYPLGVRPQARNFPRRNRIISGMSIGTLVVEATLNSGSLVTAQHATEQGREVFAIPGSIHNPMARGCHCLIRQGAKLVETANDIIEEIAPQLSTYLTQLPLDESTPLIQPAKELTNAANHSKASNTATLSNEYADERELDEDEQLIVATLSQKPLPIDQIILQTGLTADTVSSMLLMLELQGYVKACGGGHYRRAEPRDGS